MWASVDMRQEPGACELASSARPVRTLRSIRPEGLLRRLRLRLRRPTPALGRALLFRWTPRPAPLFFRSWRPAPAFPGHCPRWPTPTFAYRGSGDYLVAHLGERRIQAVNELLLLA